MMEPELLRQRLEDLLIKGVYLTNYRCPGWD